ncbi:hypothetical protein [Caulobacter sp. DWR2-3-1b2]|uniref:hypothetical protein n=1 Tax=unclassified Caulobacter TaxID=2648921 RepID=UPI003CEFB26A
MRWRPVLQLGVCLIAAPLAVQAADYRFEAASPSPVRWVATTILVKVSPVEPGRIMPALSARNATLSPASGRAAARLPAFFKPSLDYGLLRFRADLPTTGDWVLAFTLLPAGEPTKAAIVNL